MSAVLGALAAAATVAALAGAAGVLAPGGSRVRSPAPSSRRGAAGRGMGVGVGASAPAPAARAAAPPARLVVPVVVLVGAVAMVLGPVVAGAGTLLVGLARMRAARSALRRRERAVETSVPDLIDLFVIAAAAGHPAHTCLTMVADRAPAPVRAALADARSSVLRGMPLAEALRILGASLGILGPALCGALATSATTGAPLGPALRDVAVIARDRRRRDAENEARRLPVTLLFPLVCCVLPAFVLLAVVPLLAASLRALEI